MNTQSPDLDAGAASAPTEAGHGVAGWLSFAAAPTFAIMALLTVLGGGRDTLCLSGHEASPLTGMVAMYLLMSAFHSAPWLKLAFGRRTAIDRH